MAPFEALHERKCKTPLARLEPGEKLMLRPKMVQKTLEGSKGSKDNTTVATLVHLLKLQHLSTQAHSYRTRLI